MMDDILIQRAVPEEAKLISELALRSKGYWGYDHSFLEDCREELTYTPQQIASESYCFYVAKTTNHSLAGFFAINHIGSDVLELEALFIAPENIGTGIGKTLLNEAIKQAKIAKALKINIQGDPNAEGFYLANGATKVGETESHSIPGRFLPQFEVNLSAFTVQ